MQADAGDLDYTLIYGPSLAAVVEKYTRLTGRPALLPRWAFGYLGSTMHYTDAPDAAVQLARFIALCREHAIPCDMFHLSSGYTTDANGQRNVFTWNRAKVPDPAALIAGFHDAGIRLAANAKPYLLTTHPAYAEAAASGAFIADPETGGPAPARFWSGGMNEAGDGAYLDFTSEAGFGWWQRNLRAALLDYGIDAAWNDNNEFELWDDDAVCAGFGRPLRLAHARPLHTLLMARASYEAQAAHQPDQRPFVLTRAGVPGIGRYAQTWTGDNATSWHTLRWNIPMGLGLGLSGLPHNGHDIGGFTGPAPDPELFARWVWNGIFQPRFAIHSWNTDGTVNEPWMHPSVTPIVRDAIMWRCRLRPLLYTLAWQAHTLGHPLARPLAWHFPNDPACRTESFDHLLGAHLLVASVFEPGARARPVYLPAGVWWCEWATGRWYEGGRTVEADAPLERIPVFVRAGAVLPLGAPTADPGGWAAAPVLHVYARTPGDVADALAASGVGYHLFEDDGASFGCARGEYALLRLDWDGTTARLVRVGGERAPHWNAAAVVIHGEAGTRETTAAVG
jgi:alpha-glucosidase